VSKASFARGDDAFALRETNGTDEGIRAAVTPESPVELCVVFAAPTSVSDSTAGRTNHRFWARHRRWK
jgi:hypothetical protein